MSKMKKVTMIVDMQFGSTGKGLIAGYIAKRDKPDTVVTAWSMNAGHTFIDSDGTKYVHSMLANGIVSPNLRRVMIAPGSQIGIDCLMREVGDNLAHLHGVSLLIHEHACVIQQRHIEQEGGTMTAIGSTKKGCGAALIEKIQRNPENTITAGQMAAQLLIPLRDLGVEAHIVNTEQWLNTLYNDAVSILVEGAQGYSLGMNSGFYPYTTSRECTPAQILSDCLIPVGMLKNVVGVMRMHPIRVANRFDADGNMVGYSGPCYDDQEEITFESLGLEPELTTVTKLPRRIFTFSRKQMQQAIQAIQPDEIFINFLNYPGEHRALVWETSACAMRTCVGTVRYAGIGPTVDDIIDLSSVSGATRLNKYMAERENAK